MTRALAMISLLLVVPGTVYAQSDPSSSSPGAQHVVLNHGVSLDDVALAPSEAADGAAAIEPKSDPTPPAVVVRRSRPARSMSEAMRRTDTTATPWYRNGLGALAVVLAIVGLVAWAVRRWLPSARICDSGGLRVIGRTSVTPKHSAALLRVGRRYVLVGVSGERMTPLCEVSDPDEVAELTRQVGVSGADAFDKVLLNEATSYGEPTEGQPEEVASSSAGSTRPLNELLKRLKSLQRT